MLPRKIEEEDVTYYDLPAVGKDRGTFTIRRIGKGPDKDRWFLRYQGSRGGYHLKRDSSVAEMLFATPEDVLAYCRDATDNDPDWAEFRKWVGEEEFPEKMGDESVWHWGADLFPSDYPRPQN